MAVESEFVARAKASLLRGRKPSGGTQLSRKPLIKWAILVEQEAAASAGTSRLDVIHRYSQSLDQKTSGMVTFSGVIVAVFALLSPQIASSLSSHARLPLMVASALTAAFALLAALMSLSGLGVMSSKLPKDPTPEALEIDHLQRFVYRVAHFNAGLRCAQVAGAGVSTLFGILIGLET